MASSGMLRHVALIRPDISEEHSATFIKVTIICELETTPAACVSPLPVLTPSALPTASLHGQRQEGVGTPVILFLSWKRPVERNR
jgi:hypothetical protein